jgi:hypothetical protein
MGRSLVLHAGSHKTGTTAIQAELARHRDALAALDIHYSRAFPDFGANHSVPLFSMFAADPLRVPAHRRSGRTADEVDGANRRWRQALRDDIERTGDGSYVLSAEGVANLRVDELRLLRDFLAPHFDGIRVAYCIRAPDALLASIHTQLLRAEHGQVEKLRPESVEERYRAIPGRLVEVFGDESVEVYRMEDALDDGIVTYFAARFLGVDTPWIENPVHNAGLSANAARLLKIWDGLLDLSQGRVPARIDRRLRSVLAQIPGRAYVPRLEMDAALCRRLDVSVSALAAQFGFEPYDELVATDGA